MQRLGSIMAAVALTVGGVTATATGSAHADSVPGCANPGAESAIPGVADATVLGFDAEMLRSAVDFAQQPNSVSVRVYRHGCLAAKSAADTRTENIPIPMASGSKGSLMLAVGRAITLGYFTLDDPMRTFYPGLDAEHGALTVRNFLNQDTGLTFGWASDGVGIELDPVQYALHVPFAYPPGTHFEYSQAPLAVLSDIVEKTGHREFRDFLQDEVYGPIGIPRDHWVWVTQPGGGALVMGGEALRPDDQGRLGVLMAQDGRWGDRQLIDVDYLRQSRIGTDANPSYGLINRINTPTFVSEGLPTARPVPYPLFPGSPSDAYGFLGALGQLVIVVPSQDLVFVRAGIPDYIRLDRPIESASAEMNKDLKEMLRRVTAAVTDVPPVPYVDPYSIEYPADPVLDGWEDVEQWARPQLTLAALFGIGPGAIPNCNVLICHDRLAALGDLDTVADAVPQLIAALQATARDSH